MEPNIVQTELTSRAARRSDAFLATADQFNLGYLVTEQSHPVTKNLATVARNDLRAALRLLFAVDQDVLQRFEQEVQTGPLWVAADQIHRAVRDGGRIFLTGCGSTGRLGILLCGLWREFWQTAARSGRVDSSTAADWEQRAIPVMAGGDYALVRAVEGFEDHTEFGRKQLRDLGVGPRDVVFAITEGGETPFVIGTAWAAWEAGAVTWFVYNNPDEILRAYVARSRAVLDEPRIRKWNLTTGPMAITGSTRMQATSIQLAVMVTVLELVIRRLLADAECEGCIGPPLEQAAIPGITLTQLQHLHGYLSGPALPSLAQWVQMEREVYARGGRVNYYAGCFAPDVFTDTAERSPTFSVPPFRKFQDSQAAESWAFLYVPQPDSLSAWQYVCKRTPDCLAWTEAEISALVPPEKLKSVLQTLRQITLQELLRFRIGQDGLNDRPLQSGDAAVVIMGPGDLPLLENPAGFFAQCLREACEAGAETMVVGVGPAETLAKLERLLDDGPWRRVGRCFLAFTSTGLGLEGPLRVAVKMMLNAVSTATMASLGRIMGNTMVWVVPTNGKLIDRATRYIAQLTGLDYPAANRLLFEALEYLEPRMRADQTHPPVVGLAVLKQQTGWDWPLAEQRFWAETASGSSFPKSRPS
ncbi:MAG: hypothetical protein RMN51_13085 [Verrucomicrobiota bacterium]|nr:hypothetical protein [Limisphaera sp.]MDW8383029.1 hypothetical protein [Verrucomicrobiota bacterium]